MGTIIYIASKSVLDHVFGKNEQIVLFGRGLMHLALCSGHSTEANLLDKLLHIRHVLLL